MTEARVDGARRWRALGLAVLAVGVDGTVLCVALPTLSRALKATESILQWFSSGYFPVLAAAMLLAGLLGDRYARRSSSSIWSPSATPAEGNAFQVNNQLERVSDKDDDAP
jgi:MFS family permease